MESSCESTKNNLQEEENSLTVQELFWYVKLWKYYFLNFEQYHLQMKELKNLWNRYHSELQWEDVFFLTGHTLKLMRRLTKIIARLAHINCITSLFFTYQNFEISSLCFIGFCWSHFNHTSNQCSKKMVMESRETNRIFWDWCIINHER